MKPAKPRFKAAKSPRFPELEIAGALGLDSLLSLNED